MITREQFAKKLKAFVGTMSRMRTQAHELAIFGLNHAHRHGDPVYLNQFYNVLTRGMQASFKRYVVSVCAKEFGDAATSWLTMRQGEWVMNRDYTDKERVLYWREQDQEHIKLSKVEDLENRASFLEIDPDTVKNPFTTENVLNSITSLVRRAKGEDSEVPAQIIDFLEEMAKRAERVVKQATKKPAPAARNAGSQKGHDEVSKTVATPPRPAAARAPKAA